LATPVAALVAPVRTPKEEPMIAALVADGDPLPTDPYLTYAL
jgi:hypothetical protein